jgi:hypothetical protein
MVCEGHRVGLYKGFLDRSPGYDVVFDILKILCP